MKIAVSVAAVAAACNAAFGLIVPQTSVPTQFYHPLERSEMAYVTNADDSVSLMVGVNSNLQSYVRDPYSLKGYDGETIALPRSEYEICATEGLIYTSSNDTWYSGMVFPSTNYIMITASPDAVIKSVDIHGMLGKNADGYASGVAVVFFTNNIARIIVQTYNNGPYDYGASVSDIIVYVKGRGPKRTVNDLSKIHFDFKDEYGMWTLGCSTNSSVPGLRNWVTHLNDDKLGDKWYTFPASNTVRLADNRLTFDRKGRYSYEVRDATNLVMTASGKDVFRVYATGTGSGYEDAFHVTSFTMGTNFVEMAYTHDIDGFDVNNLGIQRCESLGDTWTDVPTQNIVKSNGIVRVTNTSFLHSLYRLTYNDSSVADLSSFTFVAPVVVEGSLTLKGTDGTNYLISVNGGTITATAVTQ